MKETLTKNQLLRLLDKIMHSKAYGLSEKEVDDVLLTFCAGCPDPVRARWLIVECLDPMDDSELVDRALAMPCRLMSEVPFTEFPEKHPLRAMVL